MLLNNEFETVVKVYRYIYPKSLLWSKCDTKPIFKWNKAGLNPCFSFYKIGCLTNDREPRVPCYLPITGGRTDRFMPFPRVFV